MNGEGIPSPFLLFKLPLTPGKLIVYNDRVYIGDVSGNAMEVVTLAHELNIGNIGTLSSLSAEQILDKMVEKGIGISSGGIYGPGGYTDYSDIIEGYIALGATVTMAGMQWTVCHVDNAGGVFYMIKTTVDETTQFGSSTNYYGSTIANKCQTFYNNLPPEVKEVLLTVGVFGVQQKVFIPKASWVGDAVDGNSSLGDTGRGMFDYFISDSARIAYNSSGSARDWWTASAYSSSSVWRVGLDGSLGSNYGGPSGTYGFRPCVALKL